MYKIEFAKESDFDKIYALFGKNTDLLGRPFPAAIREALKLNKVLIVRGEEQDSCFGFCNFNVLKREFRITVYEIAVDEAARGHGLGRRMVEFLEEKYKRPIQAKCVKGSPAELFWERVAELINYEKGKKRELSVFLTKKYRKEIKKRSLI